MGKNQSASNLTNVIQVSSTGNVLFVSGSTTLMSISSSGAITTTGVISGSNALSASYASASTSASYSSNADALASSFTAFSSSILAQTASFNAFSASIYTATSSFSGRVGALESYTASLNLKTASFATTGSNNFTAAQHIADTTNPTGFDTTASLYTEGGFGIKKDTYISSSLYIKGNLTVYGTQSVSYITSSQLNISTNLITVNTATPSIRFGGIAVQDSGSANGLTGSLLWDSQNNSWLYNNPSGSGNYDSSLVIMGPRNSSALGNEVGLNCNYLIQGHGHHHTTSSAIFHDGSTTCFFNTTSTTTINGGTSAIFLNSGVQNSNGIEIRGGSAGTAVNWKLEKDNTLSNAFQITPSTAAGGTTFSTPAFTLTSAVACFSGTVCASSFIGGVVSGTTLCTSNGIIGNNSNNLYLSSNSSAGEISFWGNQLNTRLMTILGNGCVGIGCSSPGAQLVVYGACNGDTTLHVQSGTVSGKISFSNNTANAIYGGGWWGYMGYSSATYYYFSQCIVADGGLKVTCNVSSNCFTGITVVNSAGGGSECARAGIAFQAYDWVQSAIWHGRQTSAAFEGALLFGTNPNTVNLGVGGVCTRLRIDNSGIACFACQVCAPYICVGRNAGGDTTNYGLSINRHGDLNCSHAYTTVPAFIISEFSNAGPTSGLVDVAGIWNLSFGRYSHTMTNAKFASLMFIGYDGAMGPLRVDGRGNMFVGYDRTAANGSDATFSLLVACGIAAGSYQYCVPPSGGALFSGTICTGGHIIPTSNGTLDLGSSSNRWCTVYTSDLSLNNGIGNYTIVEGKNDLFLYNNNSCKVYKFIVQEVCPEIAPAKRSI